MTSFPETLALVELGRKQVLSVEDWAEIRRLRRAEQLSISETAPLLGISRNTVRAALASSGPPTYDRAPAESVADAFEPRIRELLAAFPAMPATVIGERIGWPYSIRTLSSRVAQLRQQYLPPDPVSRTSYDRRRVGAVRFLVPAGEDPGRIRADPHRDVAAGADHGRRLLALGGRGAGAVIGARRTCPPAGGS